MALHVKPISALLTRDTQIFSKMDPYVVAIVGVEKQRSRTHQEGGKKPRWTDEFIFRARAGSMLITVYDEDIVSDDVVGSANVDLKKYFDNPIEHEESIKLCYKGKQSGTLKLKIHYMAANQNQGQNYFANINQYNTNNNGGWGVPATIPTPSSGWQTYPTLPPPQNPQPYQYQNNNTAWNVPQTNINIAHQLANIAGNSNQVPYGQPMNTQPALSTDDKNIWQNILNASVGNNLAPSNGYGYQNNGWGAPTNYPPQPASYNNGWGSQPNTNNGWGYNGGGNSNGW